MSIFPQITQFPSPIVNYQLSNAIVAQTYENTGLLPYQYYVTNVGYLGELNYNAALIQNKAKAQLVNKKYDKKNIPTQYLFTSDRSKLKDFTKIRLYSPSAKNRNPLPGLVGKAKDEMVALLNGTMDAIYTISFHTIDFRKKLDTVTGGADGANQSGGKSTPQTGATGLVQSQQNENVSDIWFQYLDSDAKGNNLNGALRPGIYNKNVPGAPQQNQEDIITDDKYNYREIYLPMPIEQIIDSHSHEVNSTPLNPIHATIELLGDAWTHFISNKFLKNKQSKALQTDTGNLINYVAGLTVAGTRKTVNPNVEVLYQTPSPREFQFTFNYIPTNKDDADTFLLMCDILKEHSYPISFGKDSFFEFPGTCDFEFWINNNKATQLPYNKKPCFLTNVMVSYLNGTGTYTHYWDGNPTSIVLTLTFLETELLSRIDFIPQDDAALLTEKEQPKDFKPGGKISEPPPDDNDTPTGRNRDTRGVPYPSHPNRPKQ